MNNARPSFTAVGFMPNELGHRTSISFAIVKSLSNIWSLEPNMIILKINRDLRIYQNNNLQRCIHMFSDISLEKKENIYILETMSDYITNSKNRKLKTKILLFLSRINIWASKLPLSWRVIILMECILFCSLFFPWINLIYLDGSIHPHYAFSQFSLYIGYGILLAIIIIPFFLLSHTKKEHIRSMVPFRLSDTQAIVFIMSILLTTLINLIVVNNLYSTQIAANGSTLTVWFKVALAAILCMIGSTFFLSRFTKTANTEIYYLDHQIDNELIEYEGILNWWKDKKKRNMSLPI